jgi:phospholipid-translocating ATPase
MFERLSSSESAYRQVTQQHINEYADAGLRTLVLAYRELEDDEYAYFDRKFTAAKNSVSADREENIEAAADLLERNLLLSHQSSMGRFGPLIGGGIFESGKILYIF